MECRAGITEKATREFFERLGAIHGADGCVVEEVETNKSQMSVLWKVRGATLPAAEVVPLECALPDMQTGPTFAMRAPQALRTACPATVPAALAIVRQEAFGTSTSAVENPRVIGAVVVATALAVIAFNLAMVLRHRRSPVR